MLGLKLIRVSKEVYWWEESSCSETKFVFWWPKMSTADANRRYRTISTYLWASVFPWTSTRCPTYPNPMGPQHIKQDLLWLTGVLYKQDRSVSLPDAKQLLSDDIWRAWLEIYCRKQHVANSCMQSSPGSYPPNYLVPWWRHQMGTFSALQAFCAENSPVNSPHKGQWRRALMFSLTWINGWVNNRETGDLRRHRAHYDVIVMVQSWSFW